MNIRALARVAGMSLALGMGKPAPLPLERYCEGHTLQEAFLKDTRRVRVALWSRRTGKTVLFAVLAARGAQGGQSGQWVVYITRTRKNAKKQVWPWIKRVLRESGVPHTVNESELSIEIEGAGGILLGGADNIAEIEKYRGFSLIGAIVDECGIYPSTLLITLMDEVLEPATVDSGGWLVFGGTPGYVMTGRWYELSGPTAQDTANCGIYRGNLRSNPHLMSHLPPDERAAAVEAFLADVRERNGWSESHPTFVREWMGLWQQDDEALVFPLSASTNDYQGGGSGPWGLPSHTDTGVLLGLADWRVVIGVDVGFTQSNAYVVAATHPSLKRSYVVSSHKRTEQLIPAMEHELRAMRETYAVLWGGRKRLPTIVIDSGGMGKIHAETLRRAMGLPNEAAEKRDKASAIAMTRDAVLSGRVQLLRRGVGGEDPCAALADEWHVLVWNDDRDGIADGQEDHATDACIYALRRLRDFTRKEPPKQPKTGTKEWLREEERKMEAAAMRQHKRLKKAATRSRRKAGKVA